MTKTKNTYIDLPKAVDHSKNPHFRFQAGGVVFEVEKKKTQKKRPSPFDVHGKRGTMVILMAGALYMGTVLFMVYMTKAALG
jgi:hypothetical protein